MAGSKWDAFETDILELIFNNTAIGDIGDSAGLQGSSTTGSFYVALFTVAPGDSAGGTECTYTGYAREAVARTSGGWTISGNQVSNTAAITFGECTAGSETAVAFAICTGDVETTQDYILWGDLTSSLAISSGITPEFGAGQLVVTED